MSACYDNTTRTTIETDVGGDSIVWRYAIAITSALIATGIASVILPGVLTFKVYQTKEKHLNGNRHATFGDDDGFQGGNDTNEATGFPE